MSHIKTPQAEAQSKRQLPSDNLAYKQTEPRILLIDDDPVFLAIMNQSAYIEHLQLDTYLSLDEIGFIGLFSNYSVAIIDFELEQMNALYIANCIDTLVKELPVIIVSAKDRSRECTNLPHCVKAVISKSKGYSYILNLAASLSRRSIRSIV